jgi:hypothetical protein
MRVAEQEKIRQRQPARKDMDEMKCPAKTIQLKENRQVESKVIVSQNAIKWLSESHACAERGEIAEISQMPDLVR